MSAPALDRTARSMPSRSGVPGPTRASVTRIASFAPPMPTAHGPILVDAAETGSLFLPGAVWFGPCEELPVHCVVDNGWRAGVGELTKCGAVRCVGWRACSCFRAGGCCLVRTARVGCSSLVSLAARVGCSSLGG